MAKMAEHNKIVKIACGTDDGIRFTEDHFGSAKFYLIYTLDLKNKNINFIKKVKNTSISEKLHGDPKKAKSVSNLLKKIQVIVGFLIGPNIIHLRKKFIPVISKEKNINKTLKRLIDKIDLIKKGLEIEQGKSKNIIYIK